MILVSESYLPIARYTPYFFDKAVLDNILEESVDQHFHTLIQTRHVQRRRDVVDDSLTSEIMEEMGDSMLEPPEVHILIHFMIKRTDVNDRVIMIISSVTSGNRISKLLVLSCYLVHVGSSLLLAGKNINDDYCWG